MVYPYLVETGEVNDYYNLENKSIYRITIRGSRYRVLILFYRRKLPRLVSHSYRKSTSKEA